MSAAVFTLDEALAIVRGASLSRAVVETSTPEQIVWLTAEAIVEGFRRGCGWAPDERARAEQLAHRAVANCNIGASTREKVTTALNREFSGWPA